MELKYENKTFTFDIVNFRQWLIRFGYEDDLRIAICKVVKKYLDKNPVITQKSVDKFVKTFDNRKRFYLQKFFEYKKITDIKVPLKADDPLTKLDAMQSKQDMFISAHITGIKNKRKINLENKINEVKEFSKRLLQLIEHCKKTRKNKTLDMITVKQALYLLEQETIEQNSIK